MDLSKFDNPQRVTAIGGIVLLVASFLPWYSLFGFNVSGWGAGALAILGIITGLGAAGLIIYDALSDGDLQIGPFVAPQVALLVAVASVLLLVLRLVTALDVLGIGLIVGLVSAGAIAFGAYRSVITAGLTVPFADAISATSMKDETGKETQ